MLEDTSNVGCLGGYPESRIARSPVLLSPDGRFAAYAEIQIFSVLAEDPDASPPCAHESKVFLVAPDSDEFHAIYAHLPRDEATGNNVWLVDWSPDGRTLLFGEAEWQYETEYYARTYRLHDALANTPLALNLDPVLENLFEADCAVESHLMGFAEDGRLVLAVVPVVEEDFERLPDEEEPPPSCVDNEVLFFLNSGSNKITPAPEGYAISRFGIPDSALPADEN